MSVVTYGELAYGARKSQLGKAALAHLQALLSSIEVLPLPEAAGLHYGGIRAELERRGEVISSNDLWIAAHALADGLILVTNNEREFRRVPGLTIENWIATG
jgi:tRNA(fMet)-specific endonuclease VapC